MSEPIPLVNGETPEYKAYPINFVLQFYGSTPEKPGYLHLSEFNIENRTQLNAVIHALQISASLLKDPTP